MTGYRIVGVLFVVLGALVLTGTVGLVYVREFREPAACGLLGRPEPEGAVGMSFLPSRSVFPLGIACTYDVEGGATETVHPSWAATVFTVSAAAAIVGGAVLTLLPQRRRLNRWE